MSINIIYKKNLYITKLITNFNQNFENDKIHHKFI